MVRAYHPEVLRRLQRVELEILSDFAAVCDKYEIDYFVQYGSLIGAIRHQGFIPWDDDIDVAMLRGDYERFCKIFSLEMGEKYVLMSPIYDRNYASSVTKIEKKGTTFISEVSMSMQCMQGIFMDIFIYDKVATDEKLFKKQCKKTRFYARLLFLSGSPIPEIPYKGLLGFGSKIICRAVHYILKLIPNVNQKLFDRFEYYSKAANNENTQCYTTFEDTLPVKSSLSVDWIYPLQKCAYEDILVNVPSGYDKILTKWYGDYMKLPDEKDRINHAAKIIDFGDGMDCL